MGEYKVIEAKSPWSFGLPDCQELVADWVDEFFIDLTVDSDQVLAVRIFDLIRSFKKYDQLYENEVRKIIGDDKELKISNELNDKIRKEK